ncbi:protein of unknown function [Methylocaldum szegediense]|uniref:Transposase n=1 Tax=Methylocaldum szegediense TaxID=73780 RepID=A0ABM9I3F4_9GAMM|nr:protein of unknown function [Methylocaldum szegediense]
MYFMDEVLKHLFRDGEIGDHTVFERADSGDVAGCSSQHRFCGRANRRDRFLASGAILADSHHRWLVYHNALATNVDQGVCGAKVNGQVVREESSEVSEEHRHIVLINAVILQRVGRGDKSRISGII